MSSSFSERQYEPWKRRRIEPATENSSAEPDTTPPALYNYPSSEPSHHEYSAINASGQATLHLGDVHYHVNPTSTKTKEQLMAALHFPEMFSRFENIQDPHNDTFDWVLKPPKRDQQRWSSFVGWLHQAGGLYWISGKPGSGKSVLTKYLTQNAQQTRGAGSPEGPMVLSFWF